MHEWIIIKRATDEFSCIISPSCYWTVWSTREIEKRGSREDEGKKGKDEERSGGKELRMKSRHWIEGISN